MGSSMTLETSEGRSRESWGWEIQRAQAGRQAGGHHTECILKHTPGFTEGCKPLPQEGRPGKAVAMRRWSEVTGHLVGYMTASITLIPTSCSSHHLSISCFLLPACADSNLFIGYLQRGVCCVCLCLCVQLTHQCRITGHFSHL